MFYLTPAEADPLLYHRSVSNLQGAAAARANSRAVFFSAHACRKVG
jgi:hypothetical protein